MEKYMNMPVLLGHISDMELGMIFQQALAGCPDSRLLYHKYRTEVQFDLEEREPVELPKEEKVAENVTVKFKFFRKFLDVINLKKAV